MPTSRRCLFIFPLVLLSACAAQQEVSKSGDLPDLMVQRLALMDKVAEVKRVRRLPIEDPVREAAVLREMELLAKDRHMDPQPVRAFFEGQMKAARLYQAEVLKRPAPGASGHQPLPDLAKEVRPELDRIGRRIIEALHQSRGMGHASALTADAERLLRQAGYSDRVVQAAVSGLRAGLSGAPPYPVERQ